MNVTDNADMNLNGMSVIARTKDAVYLRIPRALQMTSQFADGRCSCGHCDGMGRWDALLVPVNGGPHDWASTVHMPDSSVAGFMEADKRRRRTVLLVDAGNHCIGVEWFPERRPRYGPDSFQFSRDDIRTLDEGGTVNKWGCDFYLADRA